MTSVTAPQHARPTSVRFAAIGTANHVHASDPDALVDAAAIARDHLDELDRAASRFRPDSEVSLLARLAKERRATIYASPILAYYLRQALRVARLTDGLVDPTVGAALIAHGYDRDLADVQSRSAAPGAGEAADIPGWQEIDFDPQTGRLSVPAGTVIDLGASAKAAAADRIAALLAARLPGGFLVNLGGDIAVAGELPEGGWRIGVERADATIAQVVTARGQAFATSSTQKRTWHGGEAHEPVRHHILDPRTGRSAHSPWAQVTCAAASALEANAASTASIILGLQAPEWLRDKGIPARLDHLDGGTTMTPGWPEADR